MDIWNVLLSKPVLIGLHLGFAIIGIDALLWLLGEVVANAGSIKRRLTAVWLGIAGFVLTWIIGGYYYVKYYGALVKPVIKAGNAPWAHAVAMEAKEHIFLFMIPIMITIYFLARLNADELHLFGLRRGFIYLTVIAVGFGLGFGLMGFIISAAARWGVI